MTIVEHAYPGFQWAEPLEDKELQVKLVGTDLEIAGRFPSYFEKGSPCDLINQFESFPKKLAMGWQITGTQSPEMQFANADTDEDLVSFIRKFGPVVAKSVKDTRLIPDSELGEPRFPGRLIATQDMQELRNEAAAYRAALSLVMELNQPRYDNAFAQEQMRTIAKIIKAWPRQWRREKTLSGKEPRWKIGTSSINRIEASSNCPPDPILQPQPDGRIVICELLNAFPSTVFPNLLEFHSYIEFGIRPLLYSMLRRQFLFPRGFSICPNIECRNFFSIDRSRQQFCTPECSIHHRQRIYWAKKGKKRRKKRIRERKKIGG